MFRLGFRGRARTVEGDVMQEFMAIAAGFLILALAGTDVAEPVQADCSSRPGLTVFAGCDLP